MWIWAKGHFILLDPFVFSSYDTSIYRYPDIPLPAARLIRMQAIGGVECVPRSWRLQYGTSPSAAAACVWVFAACLLTEVEASNVRPLSALAQVTRNKNASLTTNVNKRNKMLTYSREANNNQTKQNANMTNKTIAGHEHNRLLSERSLMKPSITLLMLPHVHVCVHRESAVPLAMACNPKLCSLSHNDIFCNQAAQRDLTTITIPTR